MLKKISLLFLLLSFSVNGQDEEIITLGKTSLKELQMTAYEKDSSAGAVVLYENGLVHFNLYRFNNYTKNYYVRIKILNKSALKYANIKIPFYKDSRVENIEAITYNLSDSGTIKKSFLDKKDIFKEKYNKSYRIKSFALPNVKIGSVIEYKYTYTRYGYGVYNWNFQSEIPKIKSVYRAYLSGIPKYKVRMIGFLRPTLEKTGVKKKCVGISRCSELYYEMDNVPAFKVEKYLSSKYNYLSRLTFEKEYKDAFIKKGNNKDWRALDKGFIRVYKHDLNLAWYYKKHLPRFLFQENDELKKAKNIYAYIKKVFTVDNKTDFDFNKILEKKIGTSNQINLALYNALKAANLDVKMVFLSTRNNGFVTKLHATINDFNYNIVKLNIGGKHLLLDATDKSNPFGLLPFKCLNGEGRVLDFKKGSYWSPIKPTIKSKKSIRAQFVLKDNEITGDVIISRSGYNASFKRAEVISSVDKSYKNELETENVDLEINEYSNENLKDVNSPFKEVINATIELENENNIKINPFLVDRLKENPFKLNQRLYPVDYGYKRNKRYVFSLTIPDNYKILSLPKNKAIRLPNNGGKMMLSVMNKENVITLLYKLNLNKRVYSSQEYHSLKEFYNQLIKTQDTFIELEKK